VLLSDAMDRGALVRAFAATRDPGGLARLRAHCDASPEVSERAAARMLHRSSLIMAARGGTVAEITVGDVAELLDAESAAYGRIGDGTTLFYKTLREIGILGDQAPPALRHLRTPGQLTPEQMIDRYNLACRPVRDLLADYLKERQPALDYNSLDALFRILAGLFWADLEAHHPGVCSLRLPGEVARCWKQRLQTTIRKVRTQAGQSTQVVVPRLSYRECLTPVRAFYLDLANWAVEDRGRWAAWVAPCPVSHEEGVLRKYTRQRKARMDTRTRERLPVLPALVAALDRYRKETEILRAAADSAQPGKPSSLRDRSSSAEPARTASGRTMPPASTATCPSKRRTPSGPGQSWRSCVPRAGSRNASSSATTAWCSTGFPPLASSSRCCRSCRRRPTKNVSWWSARNWPTCSPASSAGSGAHSPQFLSSPPTTTTHGCGWRPRRACSSAASTQSRAFAHSTILKMLAAAMARAGLAGPEGQPHRVAPVHCCTGARAGIIRLRPCWHRLRRQSWPG